MSFDPDIALNYTRSRIGAPPRQLLGWRRMTPPDWLRPDDAISRIYHEESRIVRVGEVRWAAVVHANATMYRPGAVQQYSGAQVIYATDPDLPLATLFALAGKLFRIKTAESRPDDPDVQRVADMLAAETQRALDWPIPLSLTYGAEIFTTIVMLPRQNLAGGVLGEGFFPVLADPQTRMAVLIPSTHWHESLRAIWREGAAELAQRAAAEAAKEEPYEYTPGPTSFNAPVVLTPRAADEIRKIIRQQKLDPARAQLRVFLNHHSNGGFSYQLDVNEDAGLPGEKSFVSESIRMRVPPGDEIYLKGTVIDFVINHEGKGFVFRNPNARR
jgi:iron-sulfur cluster assembly protein